MLQVLGEGLLWVQPRLGVPGPSTARGGRSPSVLRHSRAILMCKGVPAGLEGEAWGHSLCHEWPWVSPTAELSPSAQPQSVLGERDRGVSTLAERGGAPEVECPLPRGGWSLKPVCAWLLTPALQ